MPTVTIRGWRKWSVAMTAILVAGALCGAGQLAGSEFTMVAVTSVGAFTASNAYSKRTDHGGQ